MYPELDQRMIPYTEATNQWPSQVAKVEKSNRRLIRTMLPGLTTTCGLHDIVKQWRSNGCTDTCVGQGASHQILGAMYLPTSKGSIPIGSNMHDYFRYQVPL